jgi:hypothetical protein
VLEVQQEVQVSKSISGFKGAAGTIYIERAEDAGEGDRKIEVWFEDFCILGLGHTELEALNDAWSHTGDIMALIADARLKVIAGTANAEVKQQPTGTDDIS